MTADNAIGRAILALKVCDHIAGALQAAEQLAAGNDTRGLDALCRVLQDAAHYADSIHYQLDKEARTPSTQVPLELH